MIMEAPAPKQEYAGVQLTLENCLFPEEMLTPTPSSKDGLDELAEQDLRLFGCEAIQIAGIMLRLPQVAMATAQVLFHRFFFVKSFIKFKMEEAAMACIWLASKVEEAPRRVRDVLNVFHYMKERKKKVSSPAPLQLDGNYVSLKSNVIKLEKKLLKELGFCVHVKHPHKIIVIYLQQLDMERNLDLVQTSWNYMNDSLRSTVFVKYRPETIACACIYMAARVLQVPLPNQPHWFYLFNATEEEIQKISAEILQVYHRKRVSLDELDTKLEACRQKLRDERIKAREAATAAAEAENAGSMSDSAASPKDKKSDEKASSKHDDNRDESKRKSSQKSEQSSSANSSKHQRSSSIPHHSKYDNEDSGRHRSPHRHSRPKSRPSSSSRNKPPPEFDLPKSYSSYDGDDSHKSKSSSKSRDHKRSYHRSSGGSHKRNKHEHVSRSSSPPEKSHKSSHKKHSKHKHAHE